MQSDIRREIVLAIRHVVPAPIAFCFAASEQNEEHACGLHAEGDAFTELPMQCERTLAVDFLFPSAVPSPTRYCVDAAAIPRFGIPASLLSENGPALFLYLRLGHALFGVAGLARREGDAPFDEADVHRLEQIGPVLSSLTMLHHHVLQLQRQRPRVCAVPTSLSEREQQVARLLADGYSCVNTAAVLNLSENTVRTYVRRLYRKLSVTNRVDLVQRLISTVAVAS